MSKPRSASLFHFTGSINFLKNILKNGLFPRYCQEDHKWFGIEERVAYPMCCFCDIPLSRINEHTSFYGTYGVGFTKEWGLKNKLNPVIYCSDNGLVPSISKYLLHGHGAETNEQKKDRELNFWRLLKLVKPLSGSMIIGGEPISKDFYQENEWRFTPEENISDTILFEYEYKEKIEEHNKAMENHKLEFLPSDVKYIFVKQDSDIPEIVDFINNNLGRYPLNDLKILSSRIISLDTVAVDL